MSKEQVLKNKLGQTHDCISLYHKDIYSAMEEYAAIILAKNIEGHVSAYESQIKALQQKCERMERAIAKVSFTLKRDDPNYGILTQSLNKG